MTMPFYSKHRPLASESYGYEQHQGIWYVANHDSYGGPSFNHPDRVEFNTAVNLPKYYLGPLAQLTHPDFTDLLHRCATRTPLNLFDRLSPMQMREIVLHMGYGNPSLNCPPHLEALANTHDLYFIAGRDTGSLWFNICVYLRSSTLQAILA